MDYRNKPSLQEKKQYDGALKKINIKVTREDTGRILYTVNNSIKDFIL